MLGKLKLWGNTPEKKGLSFNSLISLLDTAGSDKRQSSFIDEYVQSSPIFIATKLIADAISGIPIILKDTRKDELIYHHHAIDIINNPHPFKTGALLMEEIASYYILTGNAYLKITGRNEPVELDSLNPNGINIRPAIDGYPSEYEYSYNGGFVTFKRDNRMFLDALNNEICHLRDFNPNYSSNQLLGYSMFSGCILEVIQGITANIHNNAMLNNQARPSGLITFDGEEGLSDEQVSQVIKILQTKISGAANAGKATFLNGKFKWTQLSESMKDMDFHNLQKRCEEVIFKAAKIPLAMISPDNMSFANMDASKYAFYDNAVFPVFKNILALFNKKILSRYKGTENLVYWFDESSIESLQIRKLNYAKELFFSGIATRDESRIEIGLEPAINGDDGNAYHKPSNRNSGEISNAPTDAKAMEKSDYIRLMKNMKNTDGQAFYSDKFIDDKVKQYYS